MTDEEGLRVGDRERPDVVALRPPDADELELPMFFRLIGAVFQEVPFHLDHVAADRPDVVGARRGAAPRTRGW